MQSTLKPKQTDDPHDILVVAPDVARVAPPDADEELANLLREAARHHSDPQTHTGSDSPAAPPVPRVDTPVPPVDTTFRPTAVNDLLVAGHRRSIGGRAVRAFTALLLAACIGGAAIAWQSSGTLAKQVIAKWAPKLILTSLLPSENTEPPAQPAPPAVQAADANAAPPQPAPPVQSAAQSVASATAAPSADSAQLIQSMARDLASVGQEVEQLRASIEQLKAGQQQMSRDAAKTSEVKASEVKASEVKASEQNLRPKTSAISALPPRPPAARARKPMPPPYYPPLQAAAASALPQTAAPQTAAPYVPRKPEPPPQAAQPPADPEL
jgi:hypothetical protein